MRENKSFLIHPSLPSPALTLYQDSDPSMIVNFSPFDTSVRTVCSVPGPERILARSTVTYTIDPLAIMDWGTADAGEGVVVGDGAWLGAGTGGLLALIGSPFAE